jgi:hypothetical protein
MFLPHSTSSDYTNSHILTQCGIEIYKVRSWQNGTLSVEPWVFPNTLPFVFLCCLFRWWQQLHVYSSELWQELHVYSCELSGGLYTTVLLGRSHIICVDYLSESQQHLLVYSASLFKRVSRAALRFSFSCSRRSSACSKQSSSHERLSIQSVYLQWWLLTLPYQPISR